MTEHRPRYRFDCERCKFSWNCGPQCSCALAQVPLRLTPRRRLLAVAKERQDGGFAGAAAELVRDWKKAGFELAAEIMES